MQNSRRFGKCTQAGVRGYSLGGVGGFTQASRRFGECTQAGVRGYRLGGFGDSHKLVGGSGNAHKPGLGV